VEIQFKPAGLLGYELRRPRRGNLLNYCSFLNGLDLLRFLFHAYKNVSLPMLQWLLHNVVRIANYYWLVVDFITTFI
jgi:hypothetical protein